MIVVTTQPDEDFYLWQLKLQAFNLKKFGFTQSTIYALVSYDAEREPNPRYKELEEHCNVLYFPDNRIIKTYSASIKPYLMAQFIEQYNPDDYIFYIDSDVLMLRPIEFSKLEDGHNWYGSDVEGYLSYDYITSKGIAPLLDMCDIVGINPQLVRRKQKVTGGCHYYFKGTTSEFWRLVEHNSIMMYHTTLNNRARYEEDWRRISRDYTSTGVHTPLQEWTAEMWATMWEVYKQGKDILPHNELYFCFRDSSWEEVEKSTLLHYTGIYSKAFFMKEEYHPNPAINSREGKQYRGPDPLIADLSYVDMNTSSGLVVHEINAYRRHYGI